MANNNKLYFCRLVIVIVLYSVEEYYSLYRHECITGNTRTTRRKVRKSSEDFL